MVYTGQKQGTVQTGYTDQPLDGFPGQLASINDPYELDAYPTEGAVRAGIGVVNGADITETANEYYNIDAPFHVRTPVGTSVLTNFVGIAVRMNGISNDENGVAQYNDEEFASILRKGRVYVETPVAVTRGDPVWMYVDNATSHDNPIGSFTNADAGSGDTIQITHATWWKRSPADTIAIIELTRP